MLSVLYAKTTKKTQEPTSWVLEFLTVIKFLKLTGFKKVSLIICI